MGKYGTLSLNHVKAKPCMSTFCLHG